MSSVRPPLAFTLQSPKTGKDITGTINADVKANTVTLNFDEGGDRHELFMFLSLNYEMYICNNYAVIVRGKLQYYEVPMPNIIKTGQKSIDFQFKEHHPSYFIYVLGFLYKSDNSYDRRPALKSYMKDSMYTTLRKEFIKRWPMIQNAASSVAPDYQAIIVPPVAVSTSPALQSSVSSSPASAGQRKSPSTPSQGFLCCFSFLQCCNPSQNSRDKGSSPSPDSRSPVYSVLICD